MRTTQEPAHLRPPFRLVMKSGQNQLKIRTAQVSHFDVNSSNGQIDSIAKSFDSDIPHFFSALSYQVHITRASGIMMFQITPYLLYMLEAI